MGILDSLRRRLWPEKADLAPNGEPWSLKMGPGRMLVEYCVFVSSGDDALMLRDRVDGLVRNSVNPSLSAHGVKLDADLWERKPPRRLFGLETVDDEFVDRAKASDLVMALLLARLGSGTKKEIKAVLRSRTELATLWFVNRDENPRTEVGRFLGNLARRKKLRYRKAGRPDTPESHEAIVQVLIEAALQGVQRQRPDIRERR